MVVFNMFQSAPEGAVFLTGRLKPAPRPADATCQPCPEDESLEPSGRWTDENGTTWLYSDHGDGVCSICAAEVAAESLAVPSAVDGLRVEALASGAFEHLEDVREVRIPSSVRRIGRRAFAYCRSLERVALSEGLERIGPCAFMGTGLRSVVLPPSVSELGEKAFYYSSSLQAVVLAEGLRVIGDAAFELTDVTSLDVPASVERLGCQVLRPREGAGRLRVRPGNARYLSDGDGAAVYERVADGLVLTEHLGLGTAYAVLPGTVRIGPRAFALNTSLEDVRLPEGLLAIEESAFWGCTALARLRLPSTLRSIGPRAFVGSGLELLVLPAGLVELDDSALLAHVNEQQASVARQLVIQVEEGSGTFFVEGGLLCQRRPDGTARALRYAGGSATVSIPAAVTDVGDWLLYGITGIRWLVLHDGLAPYDSCAFAVAEAVPHVTVELQEPVAGNAMIDLWFSRNHVGHLLFLEGFGQGRLSLDELLRASDRSMLCIEDRYELGRAILGRLRQRVSLSPGQERSLRRILESSLRGVIQKFALHNWLDGFDQLEESGFLTDGNFEQVLEWAYETGSVASVGHLLELRRRHAPQDLMDAYDL